ncbi:uncharacterized protein LOC133033398 [Cannabis sativa]|uniref:uncharacterized protein LOC133033398 n=1 Tax=Cannabis sativa TaxID=3483 RepID=UPI0029CA20F1|nr:uncharacterized protein LOC133033398 [Cannabis sativa]
MELRNEILEEVHTTPYSLHPGITKMYQDLKPYFWWNRMKKNVVEFVARCLTCQQIKAEHQKPARLFQPLTLPEWKWEDIPMDIVVGLPRTTRLFDSTWVVVDRFTKSAHFLPVKTNLSVDQYADIKCRSPIPWDETRERKYLGLESVQQTNEAIEKIKARILTSQSRQKSYAHPKRRDFEFQVGDLMFLHVSPMKGIKHFGKRGLEGLTEFGNDSVRGGKPSRPAYFAAGGIPVFQLVVSCLFLVSSWLIPS